MEKAKGKLTFNAWSQEKIDSGDKICISRTKRYEDDPRVDWISPKLPLWFIKMFLWEAEGAKNPEELQSVINQIFRKKVDPSREFYVHFGYFDEEVE